MTAYIKKRKKTFVLIVPQFEDVFHAYYASEIIKGASLAASRLKSDLMIHITNRSDHSQWLDSTLLDRKYVDGIIFADIDNDTGIVKKAISAGMSCIVLNNALKMPVNFISIDNKAATIDAINHLIGLGHKRIATIAGDLSTQAGVLRLEGFKEALSAAGIRVPKNYIIHGDFLRTPARLASEKLLSLKNRPMAIFAASDVMALEIVDVAREKKIKIPKDLSIVGFDDNPINVTSSVPLTTVFQPITEMGRLGVENLHQICCGKARLPVKIMLPAKFVKRQTTKAVK